MPITNLTMQDIFLARKRIAPIARKTPLSHSPWLSELVDTQVHLKLESLQETGSFKIRGAANKILSLSQDIRRRRAIAVSSGNHGRALSYVAQKSGVRATFVLPETVSERKREAIKELGAELIVEGDTRDETVEYHIDCFRFDLAAILRRDPWGAPLANPPLLEILAHDQILGNCKLIAEAWDTGGLHQVDTFPDYGRWTEWNGKYRDTLRRFLKEDPGQVGAIAQCIQGSPNLYAGRGPIASTNFITCHDGFTLANLVSYNHKHNDANDKDNRNGMDYNISWNCGWEGPTDDPDINTLRRRQIKNALAMLLVNQGVPMILMGNETGRTKNGNNNTYCHDNKLNWLNWTLVEKNADLFQFTKNCIAFRQAHPVLRGNEFFCNEDYTGSGYADITWHGTQAWHADRSDSNRVIVFMLCGKYVRGGTEVDNALYIAMNMHWETLSFELPGLPEGVKCHVFANTSAAPPEDSWEPGTEPVLEDQNRFLVGSRSVVILVSK